MNPESVPDYRGKRDDELLRLALDPNSLTSEAAHALFAELKKRKLDSAARLSEFSQEEKHYKHLDDIDLGEVGLSFRGNGRRLYGRFNLETRGTSEEYDTTMFAVIAYFPLVPLGAYRFLREQGSKQFTVLDKRPLDWSQVLLVWLKATAVIAAVLFVLNLLLTLKK
jgi:hypothetical protein